MSKQYTKADESVAELIEAALNSWHPELTQIGLRVGGIMVTNDGDGPALSKGGWPAVAVVRILNARERLHTPFDVTISFDADKWEDMDEPKRLAVIDHELTHVRPKLDKHNRVKLDHDGRPKQGIRPHDFELVGFGEVIQRHRQAALESQGIKYLSDTYGHLLFPWLTPAEAETRKPRLAAAR
jgi:hypothetical protein